MTYGTQHTNMRDASRSRFGACSTCSNRTNARRGTARVSAPVSATVSTVPADGSAPGSPVRSTHRSLNRSCNENSNGNTRQNTAAYTRHCTYNAGSPNATAPRVALYPPTPITSPKHTGSHITRRDDRASAITLHTNISSQHLDFADSHHQSPACSSQHNDQS